MPETYRVTYDHGLNWQDFGRFDDAAAFYARTPSAQIPINLDRYDGAPDSRNSTGLTEAQREAVGL